MTYIQAAAPPLLQVAQDRAKYYEESQGPIPIGAQYGYHKYFISKDNSKFITFSSFRDEKDELFFIGLLRK